MGNGQSTVKEPIFKKDPLKYSNQEAGARNIHTTLEQVKKKILKEYPELKSSRNQLDDLARCLCDKEKLVEKYFGHLLGKSDHAMQTVQEEKECFYDGFRNEATLIGSRDRMSADISRVKKLEVKLLLYEINDATLTQQLARFVHGHFHEFTFGPFHAAIQIGDVILDWGPSGLVIPKRVSEPLHDGTKTPVFVGNLHEATSQTEDSTLLPNVSVRGGVELTQDGFQETVKLLEEISAEKEQLIDTLAQVAEVWNTKHEYGLLSNNCQHFVEEVLRVLCIEDPFKEGKLKDHAAILIARDSKKKDIAEFNSHQELDAHVRENIDRMPRDDLEFAYCHYLLFHAWARKRPQERAWKCDPQKCMCTALQQKIDGT